MTINHAKVVAALDSIATLVNQAPKKPENPPLIFESHEQKRAYFDAMERRASHMRKIGVVFVEAASGGTAKREHNGIEWLGSALVEKYHKWRETKGQPQAVREGFAEGMLEFIDILSMVEGNEGKA